MRLRDATVLTVGLLAIMAGVWTTSFQGRSYVIGGQRDGCYRASGRTVIEARVHARDALRERTLAQQADQAPDVAAAHLASYTEAEHAATYLLASVGVHAYVSPELVVELHASDPAVRAQRRAYCIRAYRDPGPFAFRSPAA